MTSTERVEPSLVAGETEMLLAWLNYHRDTLRTKTEGLGAVQELLLPLADLDGVDLVRLGEFGDGPGLLGGLQGDLGLEVGRMPPALAGHDAPRDESATFDQYNIPSCPVSGVHYTPHSTFG